MRISSKLFDYAIVFFALLILFVGVSINLNRFWQYELGYYDFGMFDRPIWLISQFQPPIIDHFIVGGKINLADHFNPIIYLFAPLYFISDRSELILIMPTIAIVLSGLFLYKIGKHVLKHSFLAFSIAFAFFMFLGTQNAIYSDFHEVTIASLTITLSCWAVMIKKSKKLLLLFLFLTLGLKEGLFIFGLSMGAFVYVYNHWKKFGMYVFSGSLLWGYAVVKFIIPAIAGRDYTYPITTSLNPFIIIPKLVTPIIKIKTVAVSLLNFLFLPIIALPTLPHIVLHYSSRFLTEGSTRWDLGLHYNAEIAPTLAVSSMLGILMIQKKFSS
ncbi:MAG: DUF2079 domain-containing protein, partial [bacterium]|nr:DUF2079 domain-containing protein [bacterium]